MMPKRRLFYLVSAAIVLVEIGALIGIGRFSQAKVSAINRRGVIEQVENLKRYLANENDERKLVSLAKKLRHMPEEVLEPIVLRAYELNSNSRDIAILASHFRPELVERVKELDPLYYRSEEATNRY